MQLFFIVHVPIQPRKKMMNTDYGKAALEDTALYQAIVEHRRKFYHLGYAANYIWTTPLP